MNQKMSICQSCGMPMKNPEDFGNQEYCCHCFANGQFTKPDMTLEEMIEHLVPFTSQMDMTEDQARKMAWEKLPKLKRWKEKK